MALTPTEHTWALISLTVGEHDVEWLEAQGIGVENLNTIYEHTFLLLTTHTERQQLLLTLKYGADQLVDLGNTDSVQD